MDITSENLVIARILKAEEIFKEGLNFYSSQNESVQVGTWNYPIGTELTPHRHNSVPRQFNKTNEVIYVVEGTIHVDLYDNQSELVWEGVLSKGDLLICLEGGHGYKTLSNKTQVLEVKNGPYLGPDIDRTRIKDMCAQSLLKNRECQ